MGSSSATSSSPSARAPSPSPSPRSMRFGSSSRSHSSVLPQQPSTSFLPVPTAIAGGGLHIPHSQADLDRLQMERQLEELSMMSSSRASSSFLSRSSNQHQRDGDDHQQQVDDDGSQAASHDDFGSSVELARGVASPGDNLSARGGGSSVGGQSSFNTTSATTAAGHLAAPSPVSTNGHHASAITLRTGLVGSGMPNFRRHANNNGAGSGFDDDRELGKMLGGAGVPSRAFSFGLSDLGFPPSSANDASTPRPTSKPRKLTEALGRSFSPSAPRGHHPHQARVPSPLSAAPARVAREGTDESLFTTLARGVENQLLQQQHRQPLHAQPSPAQVDAGGLRRSTSAGGGTTASGKKKRSVDPNASVVHPQQQQLGRRASQPRSRAVSGGNPANGTQHQQQSLYLPDVTGLTEAIGETPMRAARRAGVQEGREEANPYPLHELQTLQKRLQSLESENALSRRRVSQLEAELRVTREREAAAREEWELERGVLRRKAEGGAGEGEWERRYYEVLEEKKALEDLVASLRSQVQRLQLDLRAQQDVIGELQAQRRADQAELARRGQEVDRLRDEVRALSAEVGGLRRAFEGRERREVEVQTSPRDWAVDEVDRRLADGPARGLGFNVGQERGDLSVVREDEEEREQERSLRRAERDREEDGRRSARASPVERPASRLSDGLRMAAAPHTSPPLPSSPRMADVLPPPSPRPRSRFSTAASAAASSRPQQPPSSPHAWAASFEQEEPVIDLDDRGDVIVPDLVDLRDDDVGAAADETIRPSSALPPSNPSAGHHPRTRTRTTSADRPTAPTKGKQAADDRLPPQTVLTRVLRELEDDYAHFKTIYVELADQYKLIDAASNVAKRNVLAEHLREVIDTLEQKGDQIASLYSLLTFADRPLPASSPAALSAKEQTAFRSVKDLLRSVEAHDLGGRASNGRCRRSD